MSGRVVLGRYRIVAPLARGGMGIIYLGRLEGAAGFAKPVVIKTVIPDAKNERAAQMFAREARILSNLEHPNIVGVLDFGEVDGEYVMVLEYVHGFHLGAWSRYQRETRGEMPVAHAVEVMLPVLDALEFAHRLTRADGTPLGIVHRDVSPANILLDQQGHVKLHDFGIARMADDEFKTQDGSFRGTLSFTAPEMLHGQPASPRSDLYACGVILYQLISGANPFRREQPSETLHRVATHVPPRLANQRKDVGEALDAAVARALEKSPTDRFDSAGSFATALRAARTWSEDEATADLARVIFQDFSGAGMPELLGVESLQVRDATWRAAQATPERVHLRSSHPPTRRKSLEPTAQVGSRGQVYDNTITQKAPPSSLSGRAGELGASLEVRSARALDAPAPNASVRPPPHRNRSEAPKKRSLVALALPVALLALAGASYALFRKAPEPAPPRFLVIEKEGEGAEAAPSSRAPALDQAPPAESVALPPTASAAAAHGVPKTPRALPSRATSGADISAAFQKQRGRVEACFRKNPEMSTPQLSIQFRVEASGAVRSAALAPAAIANSPLGSCILAVARSTTFPPGDAALSFSIPITARKSGG